VREANDRGYRCVVAGECCGSYFPEFHEMGLKMIKAGPFSPLGGEKARMRGPRSDATAAVSAGWAGAGRSHRLSVAKESARLERPRAAGQAGRPISGEMD